MDESINVENINCKLIKEGNTNIYQPATVFYNPAQEFNRDLSVLVLDTFLENELWKRSKKSRKYKDKELNVLDALSASGLRGVRYCNELKNFNKLNKIYMNDLSENAIKVMKYNVKLNNLEDKCVIENLDAKYLMYKYKYEDKPFICVDLDPYGCAGDFLDGLVQSTYDGGLLMVTATDTAILCGNTPETCFAKYGSMSLKSSFCHEFGLRIVLRAIDSAATKYGRYIKPLLSLSVDFYVRIFVQIFGGPNECKKSANKTSMVYCCSGCRNFELTEFCTHSVNKKSKNEHTQIKYSLPIGPPVDRKCANCGSNHRIAGPIWNGRLHDYDFVEMLKKNLEAGNDEVGKLRFNTYRRLKGMLYVVGEELPDSPFFYSLNDFKYSLRHSTIPSADFRSAILNAGYEVSQSHTNPDSFKTTAPSKVIWDIMVVWYKKFAIKNNSNENKDEKNNLEDNIDQDYKANNDNLDNKNDKKGDRNHNQMILNRIIETDVSFEYNSKELSLSKKLNLLRYQVNPTKYWGPGSLPVSSTDGKKIDKRALNQNKFRNKRMKLDILKKNSKEENSKEEDNSKEDSNKEDLKEEDSNKDN